MSEQNQEIEEPRLLDQLEEEKKLRTLFLECYEEIVDRLKYYTDLKKEYYSIIALWILGTYFHKNFPTYSYLFFNAIKGSGKSRILKLIAFLSKDGEVLNSLTEAVLFRENGTLCIDEFESITRQGKESLRELLNSAYKQGTKVKRMKKVKGLEEKYEVEGFDVYRPIAMANIWGMEEVLGDRCISMILEKSDKKEIIDLMEIFDMDETLVKIKTTLTTLTTLTTQKCQNWCSLCMKMLLGRMYMHWNFYTKNSYISTLTTLTTFTYTNYTKDGLEKFFKEIKESGIDGRNLELAFPLFLISFELDCIAKENMLEGRDIFQEVIISIKTLVLERKSEELIENRDILIIDFLSQEPEENYFVSLSSLFEKFKQFSQINEEFVNPKWFGRRLKTLNLIVQKRRCGRGIELIPNFAKAREKIKLFREEPVLP